MVPMASYKIWLFSQRNLVTCQTIQFVSIFNCYFCFKWQKNRSSISPVLCNNSLTYDFYVFIVLGWPNPLSSALGCGEHRVHKTLRLIDPALLPQFVGQRAQDVPQNFLLAPSLKTTMHRLVVWITLVTHMPLGDCVENPEHGVQKTARGNWLAPRARRENTPPKNPRESFPAGYLSRWWPCSFYAWTIPVSRILIWIFTYSDARKIG